MYNKLVISKLVSLENQALSAVAFSDRRRFTEGGSEGGLGVSILYLPLNLLNPTQPPQLYHASPHLATL